VAVYLRVFGLCFLGAYTIEVGGGCRSGSLWSG